MGDRSAIVWTDATWNPVTGCSKVSPGCAHCYAERFALTRGKGLGRSTGLPWTPENAAANVVLHPDRLDQPLRWRRPRRIFVNSVSDLFHEQVPDGYIARVWDVMGKAPQHTFQVLTKRPERMREWVSRWADLTDEGRSVRLARGPEAVRAAHPSGRGELFAAMLESMGTPPPESAYPTFDWMEGQRWWPRVLPNVWLGVSIENDRFAYRADILRDTPAAVRFISAEPLLGPLVWRCPACSEGVGHWRPDPGCRNGWRGLDLTGIDWLIVGGESGPKARLMQPAWVRDLRDRAGAAGTAYLMKQWGEWVYPEQMPEDTFVEVDAAVNLGTGAYDRPFRVGKRRAGRLLDGVLHDEYPA